MDDPVNVFLEDTSGPERYAAVFEATSGSKEGAPPGAYLYVFDRRVQEIVRHVEISREPLLTLKENDARIFWSSDGTKCGVSIWGRMRGIINLSTAQTKSAPLQDQRSPAITDSEWLRGFDDYVDRDVFVRARQKFWKQQAKQHEPTTRICTEEQTALETNFIAYSKGAAGYFAVFEDDGDTGYLYVYDPIGQEIIQYVQVYSDSRSLNVAPYDVQAVWSSDGAKCAVIVWEKMRAIIDLAGGQQGRVKLEHRNTPGIGDRNWLKGFEHLRY